VANNVNLHQSQALHHAEAVRLMPEITPMERAIAPWHLFPDQADMARLIMYRRAIRAGLFNEGQELSEPLVLAQL
jgi:hypothetical protein